MTDDPQRTYWLHRAHRTLELAEQAIDPAIARIHRELHARYLERAAALDHARPPLRIVARP